MMGKYLTWSVKEDIKFTQLVLFFMRLRFACDTSLSISLGVLFLSVAVSTTDLPPILPNGCLLPCRREANIQ